MQMIKVKNQIRILSQIIILQLMGKISITVNSNRTYIHIQIK
jgi:hypothetical protein